MLKDKKEENREVAYQVLLEVWVTEFRRLKKL